MKHVFIILLFSLLSNSANAQNINEQLRQIKLSMLPETIFRFPAGDSVGHGYYIAKGFQEEHSYFGKHLGIDLNGVGGGDTDLGDTIYSIGNGFVAKADKHIYLSIYYRRNGFIIKTVYYHCQEILVKSMENVFKGQAIATIGNENGTYPAHLDFEVMSDTTLCFGAYGDPKGFIEPIKNIPFKN